MGAPKAQSRHFHSRAAEGAQRHRTRLVAHDGLLFSQSLRFGQVRAQRRERLARPVFQVRIIP